MNLLKELDFMAIREDAANLLATRKPTNYNNERDEAYARSKWHKAQAQKYKGKTDPESVAAAKAHDEAESDWLRISQEYTHKNPTVAMNMKKAADEKLAKSKLAQKDVGADKKVTEGAEGQKVEFTNYEAWKNALPAKNRIFKDGQIERARTTGEDIDAIVGQFDRSKNIGYIFAIYMKGDK